MRAETSDAAEARAAGGAGVIGEITADGAKLPLGHFGGGNGGGEIIRSRGSRRSFLLDESVKVSLEFEFKVFSEFGFAFFLAGVVAASRDKSLVEFRRLFVHGEVGVRIVAEVVRLQRLQLLPLPPLTSSFVQLARAIRIVFQASRLAQICPRSLRHFFSH